MYTVKYLVPTASGGTHEHGLTLGSFEEYKGTVAMCKKLEYKLVINPMCRRCVHLGYSCNGEANHERVYCEGMEVA